MLLQIHEEKGNAINEVQRHEHGVTPPSRDGELTLLDSSASSSLMELEGEGVADLLAGGEGEVWGRLAPPKFSPSWALS